MKYKIEVVQSNNGPIVKVGDRKFNQYRKFNKIGELAFALNIYPKVEYEKEETKSENGLVFDLHDPKPKKTSNAYKCFKHEFYSKIGNELGCSASVFKKHLNKLMYKTFVADLDQQHVRKFALDRLQKGYIDSDKIKKIRNNNSELNLAKADGIYNISPFILQFEKSPEQLKSHLGKGLWKKLTKNSFTKNKMITDLLGVGVFGFNNDSIVYLNNIPSAFLLKWRKLDLQDQDSVHYLMNRTKGKWNNIELLRGIQRDYIDTKEMARQLNDEFKDSWSPEKIKLVHDEYSKRINRLKYSDANFEWVNSDSTIKEITDKEFKATLLTSELDIAQEGEAMTHCVGSYAKYSSNGEYAVYSVTKDGNKFSTIGFYRKQVTGELTFSQHYGRFNAAVTDATAKELPWLILREQTKLMKEKNKKNKSNDLACIDELVLE